MAGSLSLVGASVDSSGEDVIVTSGDATLELTASSSDFAKQWVTSLKTVIGFLQQTPLMTYRELKNWSILVQGEYEGQTVSRVFVATETAEKIKAELVASFSRVAPGTSVLRDIFSPDVFLLKVAKVDYYILDEHMPLYPFISELLAQSFFFFFR